VSDGVRIELGKQVLDKGLLDREGRRCGKADDLLLELEPGREPELVALVSGPLAFAETLGRPWRAAAAAVHRLLGVADPHPVEIPWSAVDAIDVVVRLSVGRQEAGLDALPDAVRRRIVARLPGA
jgi:hypothetical protein